MLAVKVTWDDAKSRANVRKHGVSFEEARKLLVSADDHLVIHDELHSEYEDRFISIGAGTRGLILVVWTERDDETIRVISARRATQRERALYRTYMGRKQ